MRVTKRDGSSEPVAFDKITHRLQKLCWGLDDGLDVTAVAAQVCSSVYDGIPTAAIDDLTANVAQSMCTRHPDYGVLAARILVSNHQKATSPNVVDTWERLADSLSPEFLDAAREHAADVQSWVDYWRDFDLDFFGFRTALKTYLLRDASGRVRERPQHLFARVALALWPDDPGRARETYELLSAKKFTHASPTLFNAGTRNPQLSSCFLLGTGDSLESIFDTFKKCGTISKHGGGIGLHVHAVRGKGALIRGSNGRSNGLVPMLRVANAISEYVDQGGRRKGSIAVYLSPHHPDFRDFIALRRNAGEEHLRARSLFLAAWVPDLFMRRVEADATWSFFDPDACPGLDDACGDEYAALYERYEAEGLAAGACRARDLWFDVLRSQIETGVPYLLFKDACNAKSNQSNLGTIKCSNLCVAPETEILTREGYRRIADLAGTEVDVWNGEEFSTVTVRQTAADAELMRVSFSNGSVLECTPHHKFYTIDGTKPAADLATGDTLIEWSLPLRACQTTSGQNGADDTLPALPLEAPLEDRLHADGHSRGRLSGVERNVKVTGVERTGRRDATYCFTEPLRHAGVFNGVLTGQCTEIVEYTSPDEVAVCNLASLSLPAFVRDAPADLEAGLPARREFDFDEFVRVVKVATRNLDRVIDATYYPVPEARTSNLRHRPIGLGVQGLQDVFFDLRLPFDSEDARRLNADIAEAMYLGAVQASAELAAAHGPYETYAGSPASRGELQFDLWGVTPRKFPAAWAATKDLVARFGLRNSLLVAPMPTASTSQFLGNTEAFEPQTSNLYTRRTLAGDFVVINRRLVRDLLDRGLWTESLKNAVVANDGSVAGVAGVPEDLQRLYKTAWELPQKVLIDMAADRGPYVCQSQSLNLFVAEPSFQRLSSMHFYAWRRGLKTGCYYLRTRPAARAVQVTLPPECAACSG